MICASRAGTPRFLSRVAAVCRRWWTLAQQRALMCGTISLSPIRDVPFGWVYQAASGALAMGGLLLVINPGWTQDYLTRIRARLPGRVRDANPDRDTPGAP